MGFQPWYATQVYPALQIPLNTDSAPDNITGLTASNLTMILRNISLTTPTDTTGAGTFTIVTANPAVVNYQFNILDVNVTQTTNFLLIVEAVFPGAGGGKAVYDPFPFTITAI